MTCVYPLASICDLAWLVVKLLAPATGAAELFSCMPLTAGFCGAFCESVWADAATVISPAAKAVASIKRIVFSMCVEMVGARDHLVPHDGELEDRLADHDTDGEGGQQRDQ